MRVPLPTLRTRATLLALWRLSRAKMTVISAVTYLAAAVLATAPPSAPPFSAARFLRAWLFVLLTQFMTHFLGEFHDRVSDRLNRHATPLTGGSRVLPARAAAPALALTAGYTAALAALAALCLAVPAPARPVGAAMLALAWAYSAPPLKLNHRALGELDAALITSALLPYFAAAAQGAVRGALPWWHAPLALLVVPPFFVKIALFLVLNQADRRPDWAAAKCTLPVLLGSRATAQLHLLCMMLAYGSAAGLVAAGGGGWGVLLCIGVSAPYGFRISRAMLPTCPYRMDHLLAPSLFHSTLLVWGVLAHAMVAAGPRIGAFQIAFAAIFAYITVRNVTKGQSRAGAKIDKSDRSQGRSAPAELRAEDESLMKGASVRAGEGEEDRDRGGADPLSAAEEGAGGGVAPGGVADRDVTIVGAGVGGLVAAAALTKMGRSVVVLERRDSAGEAELGADLALWPGAITILRELGVGAAFFEEGCFPLSTVHMCNMDFEHLKAHGGDTAAASATILKTIDMADVTSGTGESFVLVPRQHLMDVLRRILPDGVVMYGANVTSIEEDEDADLATTHFSLRRGEPSPGSALSAEGCSSITSRIVIGADGARSKLRAHVSPDAGGLDAVRFCGEVCYRGVLSRGQSKDDVRSLEHAGGKALTNEIWSDVTALFPGRPADRTMCINYGAGMRSSFGYMSSDGEVAYWWVKVRVPSVPENRGKLDHCTWPEPLKTLHDVTPTSRFYMHPIEDSRSLPKWSTPRVVLVGDSAHVVTPNMGQGACLAVEDAFVLATELAQLWRWPDGQLEAFYNYERIRRPYAEAVAQESRKQLFLGQLSSRPAVFLREMLLKLVPASVLQNTLKKNNFPVQIYVNAYREALVVNPSSKEKGDLHVARSSAIDSARANLLATPTAGA